MEGSCDSSICSSEIASSDFPACINLRASANSGGDACCAFAAGALGGATCWAEPAAHSKETIATKDKNGIPLLKITSGPIVTTYGVLHAASSTSQSSLSQFLSDSLSRSADSDRAAAHVRNAPSPPGDVPFRPVPHQDSPLLRRPGAAVATQPEIVRQSQQNHFDLPAQIPDCSAHRNSPDAPSAPPANIPQPARDAPPPPTPLPTHYFQRRPADGASPPQDI